jgi:UDPglucose 6-dehydrogenase
MATAEEYNVPMPIVKATNEVNTYQRKRFIDLLLKELPANSTVAVWGLAFKPKTDDMREAPSIDVIQALIKAGHSVTAYDPAAIERAKLLLPSTVSYVGSPLEAVTGADALILLTEWDEFRGFSLVDVKAVMKGVQLFDGRNVYETDEVERAGMRYYGIGRAS